MKVFYEILRLCALCAALFGLAHCTQYDVDEPSLRRVEPPPPPPPPPGPDWGIYLWTTGCGLNGAMAPAGVPDFVGMPTPGTACTALSSSATGPALADEYCQSLYATVVSMADRMRITDEHSASGLPLRHKAVLAVTGIYAYNTGTNTPREPPASLIGSADTRRIKRPDETVIANHWLNFFSNTAGSATAANSVEASGTENYWSGFESQAAFGPNPGYFRNYTSSFCGSNWDNVNEPGTTTVGTRTVGSPSATDETRLNVSVGGGVRNCDLGAYLLCVTY